MNNEQKAILNWTYFIFNFPYHWEEKCFEGNEHILNKYRIIMQGHQTLTDGIMSFFSELDRNNQIKMINWVQENYLAFKDFKIK